MHLSHMASCPRPVANAVAEIHETIGARSGYHKIVGPRSRRPDYRPTGGAAHNSNANYGRYWQNDSDNTLLPREQGQDQENGRGQHCHEEPEQNGYHSSDVAWIGSRA